MNKYLIRLDDACPTMDAKKWDRMEHILDTYGIRPMIGIIPQNNDSKQMIDAEDVNFWQKVNRWRQKEWTIALHGYDHCYISQNGLNGLNPLWSRSEFAGIPLKLQKAKIRKGVDILRSHGIDPMYFFAPSHTFDQNTLIALKEESNIRIISDTIATKPYKKGDFIFIPQLGGRCSSIKISGIWTFCLHPSVMSEEDFVCTEYFLKFHKSEFIGFQDLELKNLKNKDFLSRILSRVYFTRRKLKRIFGV